MKTSLKMIYPAKILYATFFTATLVTICTLQAMERQHEDGEQTAQTQKIITLHCSDTTEFKVRYEIVIQSKKIMDVIGNLDSTDASITIADSISSKTMADMINYMQIVTQAQAERCPKISIFLRLMAVISKPCTDQTLLDYIQAADYLNFKVLLPVLCILLAQRLDPVSGTTRFRLNDMFYDVYMYYGVYKSLQKASYLYCRKQLDVDKPVAIELNDLVDFGILDDDAMTFNNNVEKFIIHLITTFQYHTLQSVLDGLSKHSNSLSIKAHYALVAHVRSLKHDGIQKLFSTLEDESTLKMALRLVYANDHKINLGDLECVDFFDNIHYWVNGASYRKTKLLSQTYLQFVLPLIEPVTKTLVTTLFLSSKKLTSLPNSIGNLSNLTYLYLANNKLTSLPDSFGNLVNLTTLSVANNKLTSLPYSIGNFSNLTKLDLFLNNLTSLPNSIRNLVNLKELDLSSNHLTDEIKEKLKQQYSNITNLCL